MLGKRKQQNRKFLMKIKINCKAKEMTFVKVYM